MVFENKLTSECSHEDGSTRIRLSIESRILAVVINVLEGLTECAFTLKDWPIVNKEEGNRG